MKPPRLIPYVEIVIDPSRRPTLNKRRSRPTSPTSNSFTSPLPLPSPRKRRRLVSVTSGSSNQKITQTDTRPPISPSASDFELEPVDATSVVSYGAEESEVDDGRKVWKGKGVDRDHQLNDEEILEDADLILPGETPPDDFELPLRVLYDFSIYNINSGEMVNVAELISVNSDDASTQNYAALGFAKPWRNPYDTEDEDEDEDDRGSNSSKNDRSDDDEAVRIRLAPIRELSIHNIEERDGDEVMDGKLYIRTPYAWYILGSPISSHYQVHYSTFWLKTRVLNLLINACLNDVRLTKEQFVKNLPVLDKKDDSSRPAMDIIGRDLCEEDMDDDEVITYLVAYLGDVCTQNDIKISQVPVIRDILGGFDYEDVMDKDSSEESDSFSGEASESSRKPVRKVSKHFSSRIASNKEKEVLKHRSKTFLTPVVNRIGEKLFEGSLEVAASLIEQDDDSGNNIRQLPRYRKHHTNPSHVVWGKRSHHIAKSYESVTMDGETYHVGDIVMVEPDEDEEDVNSLIFQASQTVNKYGNRWWFCQIRSFFEDTTRSGTIKRFHALWFQHGSKTLLQETSHSQALYLLPECDDIDVDAIFQKCNIKIMQPREEAVDNRSHDANDFHCSYLYDEDTASFLDIPPDALEIQVDGYKPCFSCDLKTNVDKNKIIEHPKEDSIIVHGITFHVADFVFICPSDGSKILEIGQITKILKDQVEVSRLKSYDKYVLYQREQETPLHKDLKYDERKLFFTEKTATISAHRLDGICHVLHLTDPSKIEEWIVYDDHFYLNQKGSKKHLEDMDLDDFAYCRSCYLENRKARRQARSFSQTNSKLVGMELFSGAGGLGVGMDLSGFVETKYAVEFSPAAAKTYITNHPDTIVYCQDSSNLLKQAVLGKDNGKGPLFSNIDGKTLCPPLPGKDQQVDFIFGGPPCQSFSRANASKHKDDIRTSLAGNMLSYVEFYEPTYFLLENVAGLLDHKLYTKGEVQGKEVESEIKYGMVKFIFRTLLALGYQVRYRLLQAGQYGAPQSRRRVIFWGAKKGVPLPEFPVPVYGFGTGNQSITLPTLEKLMPITRSKDLSNPHQFAPLKPRTVDDAIGDLPPFDWKNPHEIIPATKANRKESERRRNELGIPEFEATKHNINEKKLDEFPGFPGEGAPYPMDPQNRYQKWLRRNMGEGDLVTGQYTTCMLSKTVEATVNVPLKPLANHRDLPMKLIPDSVKPHLKKKRTLFGRMDANGHFKCVVTTLSPTLKDQWPLHPTQKRIITVREAARSQGFPDDYIFESTNTKPTLIINDQLRQIGNAVAVPFALALGKELGKAMILAWEKKMREGSVAL